MTRTQGDVRFLITARGGSKGVPRKNLQLVGGKPLVVRSIEAAMSCPAGGEVHISTDDSEIAEVAGSHGAQVTMRPPELATDTSPSELAVLHFLETHSIDHGKVVLIQPTSPFLQGDDLSEVIACCQEFDSCLTAYSSHSFLWTRQQDGSVLGLNHDHRARLRRQDISSEEFTENGAAFGMDVAGFLNHKHRFFGRIGLVAMPHARSVEIDSLEDLILANALSAQFEMK